MLSSSRVLCEGVGCHRDVRLISSMSDMVYDINVARERPEDCMETKFGERVSSLATHSLVSVVEKSGSVQNTELLG